MNTQNDKRENEAAPADADAADTQGDAGEGEPEDHGAEEPQTAGDPTAADAEEAEAGESPWAQDPAARIAELEEQVVTLKDQFLRAMAEAENVRKRSERQLAEAHKYGIANFARAV